MRGVRDATRAGSSQRRQSVNITITLIMFVASRCDPLQSRSWGACSLGIPLQSFLGIGSTLKGRIARATKALKGLGRRASRGIDLTAWGGRALISELNQALGTQRW